MDAEPAVFALPQTRALEEPEGTIECGPFGYPRAPRERLEGNEAVRQVPTAMAERPDVNDERGLVELASLRVIREVVADTT